MQAVLVVCSLLVILIQSSSGDIPKNAALDRVDQKCLNDLKLLPQIVADAFQKNYKLTEGSEHVNKYLACVWKAHGYLTEDGSFDVSKLVHWVKYSLLETIQAGKLENQDVVLPTIMKECESKTKSRGSDLGDAAVKMYNCVVDRISSRI